MSLRLDAIAMSHWRPRATIQVTLGRQSQQPCRVIYRMEVRLPQSPGWVWTCHGDDRIVKIEKWQVPGVCVFGDGLCGFSDAGVTEGRGGGI